MKPYARLLLWCALCVCSLFGGARSVNAQSTTVKFNAPSSAWTNRYVIVQFTYPDWSPYGDPITSGFGTTVYLTNGQAYTVTKDMRYTGPNVSVVASWREDYGGSPANAAGSATPTPGGTVEFWTGAAPPVQHWIRVLLYNYTQCDEVQTIIRDSDQARLKSFAVPAGTKSPNGLLAIAGPFDAPFPYSVEQQSDCYAPESYNGPTNAWVTATNTGGGTYGSLPNLTQVTPNTPDTTNITFSTNGTAGARDQTMQEGFSTLRSTIKQVGDTAHKDAQDAEGLLGAINTNLTAINGKIVPGQTNALTKAELLSLTNNVRTTADTAAQKAAGDAAAASYSGPIETFETSLGTIGVDKNGTYGIPDAALFSFNMGEILGTWNLNPLTNEKTSWIASLSRTMWKWALTVFYVIACWKVLQSHIQSATAARQATSSGESIAGTNLATPIALAMASAITITLAAIPALASMITDGAVLQVMGFNPFSVIHSAGGHAASAVGLADGFFPLDLCVFYVASYIGFAVTVSKVYAVATTVVRFYVG